MRKLVLIAFVIVMTSSLIPSASASPWAEKKTYLGKTAGKFTFGLKNAAFGWMQPWKQANNPKYKNEWLGFCMGLGRMFFDTANGVIHLATFPIPIDFPDLGEGI